MQEYIVFVSVRETPEAVLALYNCLDKYDEYMYTSQPVRIMANSLEEAKERFGETDIFKQFEQKHGDFWFYHEENGTIIQG